MLLLTSAVLAGTASVVVVLFASSALYHVYFNRDNLPDLGPFTRFRISHHRPRLRRQRPAAHRAGPRVPRASRSTQTSHRSFVTRFSPRRTSASSRITAWTTSSIPRVIGKVRVGAWAMRLLTRGRRDNMSGRGDFPAGRLDDHAAARARAFSPASDVAGKQLSAAERRARCRASLSSVIGARNVNMVLRKREEIRLSLWIEQQMRERFGSKRRAKEEIFARYASFVYMGNGQYGFARAAEYYFGRRLSTFTADDADKAAMLASIAKSPRDYAPTAPRHRPHPPPQKPERWR